MQQTQSKQPRLDESRPEKPQPDEPRPEKPRPAGAVGSEGQGVWYTGALPQGGGDDLPVLVFVPGLGDVPSTFWGEDEFYGPNDLYASAYSEGFRTAFAGFAAPGGKAMDMWKNGRLLARQLTEICRVFGVDDAVVVGHSKGGVDAETAVAYYGAGPLVSKLITLSSPHWGSQLADLAYSSFAWKLGELTGVHSDGCYSMQTEYMTEFRRMTQTRPAPRTFETFAGSGDGPALTKLRAGSRYLSRFGPNDCVVTVESAQNPRARHVATLRYDHAQMRLGRYLWPWIRGAAAGYPVEPALSIGTLVPAAAAARSGPAEPCGQILRGGPLTSGADELFYIDSGVTLLELFVTVASGGAPVFTGPGEAKDAKGEAFTRSSAPGGAARYALRLDHPAPGPWRLRLGPSGGAYLSVLRLCGTGVTAPDGQPLQRLKAHRRVLRVRPDGLEPVLEDEAAETRGLPPLPGGLYSVETALTGECPDGSTCQRSFQHSLLVHGDGEPAPFGPGGPDIRTL